MCILGMIIKDSCIILMELSLVLLKNKSYKLVTWRSTILVILQNKILIKFEGHSIDHKNTNMLNLLDFYMHVFS